MPISAYKTAPLLHPLHLQNLKTAMNNTRIKCCVLCSLLLFMLLNAGSIQCSGIGTITFPSPHKAKVHAKSRKLLEVNVVLDYDYAGPNPRHEPRGRKGGGGGTKNP